MRHGRSLLIAGAVVGAAGASLFAAASTAASAEGGPRTSTRPCWVTATASAAPEVLLVGEVATMSLAVDSTCPPVIQRTRVVFVVEESRRMAGADGRKARESVMRSMDAFAGALGPEVAFGVVGFGNRARTLAPLTGDVVRAKRAVRRLAASGGARLDLGLEEAVRLIERSAPPDADGRTDVLVLVTFGPEVGSRDAAVRASDDALGRGYVVFVACAGPTCDERAMREIARSWSRLLERDELDDLPRHLIFSCRCPLDASALRTDAVPLCSCLRIILRSLAVTDSLSADVVYVEGSAEPALERSSPDGKVLSWEWLYVPEAFTITYRVRALRPGHVTPRGRGIARFRDRRGNHGSIELDRPAVLVLGPR